MPRAGGRDVGAPAGSLLGAVARIARPPPEPGHARHCQELFDHFWDWRTGRVVHVASRVTYAHVRRQLLALQARLALLARASQDTAELPPFDSARAAAALGEPAPVYRAPLLRAPPPPPAMAPSADPEIMVPIPRAARPPRNLVGFEFCKAHRKG